MSEPSRLDELLDGLAAGWEQHGAAGPLAILLKGWPNQRTNAADWKRLWQALDDLQRSGETESADLEAIAEARRIVNSALRAVGGER